jgi:hypothetical protein
LMHSAILADDGVDGAISTCVRESNEEVITGTEEKASEFSAPAPSDVVTGSGLAVFSDASRATIFGRVAELSSNLKPHFLLQECQKCHEELSNIVDAAVRRGDDKVLSNVSGACEILIGLIDAREPKLKNASKQFKNFIKAFDELASQCDSHKNKKQPQSQIIFRTESQVADNPASDQASVFGAQHVSAMATAVPAASNGLVDSPASAPVAAAACNLHTKFCGLQNETATLCSYNSLLQIWFHIKAFRNVVLRSASEDVALTQLKILFCSMQNRQTDSRVTGSSAQVYLL